MHMDPAHPTDPTYAPVPSPAGAPPPAPSLGTVSDEVLERAGVSRAAVETTDAFLALMGAMRDHLGRVAAALDVSPPMLLTLRMLEQPLAQREIAARIGCDPSYVTSLIDRLEELEAVRRTPDPDDRRVNRIVLTDRGQRLRAEMAVDLLRDMPLVQGLDDGELGTLHQLLHRALAAAPTSADPDAPDVDGHAQPAAGTTE